MIYKGELRLLEAIHRVTRIASPAIRSLGELTVVRIGLVTIRAGRERDRRLEVCLAMARLACNVGVLSEQRELGLRMIKPCCDQGLFPVVQVVAGFAALLNESATVRVVVTGGTTVELDAGKAWFPVPARRMALRARDLHVRTTKRKLRLFVIETSLPVNGVVTLCAIRSQLAFVLIFVTIHTRGAETQEGPIGVARSDQRVSCGSQLGRVVALTAAQSRVLAVEDESGLAVIESLLRRLPSYQREISSVMFRVAFDAS